MLPEFKYHPNPLDTGAFVESDKICECCGESRGFIYASQLYCTIQIDAICPWCIAEGRVAKKFKGIFNIDFPLAQAGLSSEIIDEVTERTPGLARVEHEHWESCCSDACEYHGLATRNDILAMDYELFRELFSALDVAEDEVLRIKREYQPGGNPAIYKWRCRHCGGFIYSIEASDIITKQ